MYNFSDRFAVVTGAAQGIGYSIAERFVKEGIKGIALIDANAESLGKAVESLKGVGSSKVIGCHCNIVDYEEVKRTMDGILAAFGRVDILVNNAGITRDAMFHKMTVDNWRLVVDVNLNGTFNCTHTLVNQMRANGFGRIVNISSKSAWGEVGQANYAATKAAIIGFTKTLAKEGARKGITANCLEPDFIETPMMVAIPEENMKMRLSQAPMQRMGRPDEVAATVVWLASDEASYINGASIAVNGGTRT
ncbi:MAG: 3-oxoacyl-ACP reductase FabG [Spirochaetales bacterium]|nr:3-oxoacyl-ACP reductase FabG [Spirochaetales bacterium]